MKRILGLAITIIMITLLFPTLNVMAWETSGDFEYIVYDNGLYSGTHIVKYTGTAEVLVIPDTIDGHIVTGIGHPLYSSQSIYEKNETLKSITISNGITHIWNGALGDCKNLTSISMPNSIIHIGVAAFRNCPELKSISIPRGVTELGKTHFPENDSYYVYNNNLFAGCTNLTEIIVDENNTNYSADEQGILYNKDKTKLIVCPTRKSGTIGIPAGVKEIFDEAFRDCVNLLGITLPESVKVIGRSSFDNCASLNEIILPDGVESIGIDAFIGCKSLKKINIPGSVKNIDSSAFGDCVNLKSVTIQYGLESIGHSTFENCTSLISIDIPNSVTSIGGSAFKDCTSLASIRMPDAMTSMDGMCVFENCINLKSIIIPEGIDEVGYSWFDGCSSLESISIPYSVKRIDIDAFKNCKSLKSINIPASVISISNNAFANCTSLTSIYIPNSVTQIFYYAFVGCTGLASVRLPNTITTIDHHTFSGCTSLTSIDIAASVKEVKYGAFENCTNLKNVIFNNPDTIIEEGYVIPAVNRNPRDGGHPEIVCPPTFSGCINLTTIYGLYGSTAQEFAENQEKVFIPFVKVKLNGVDLDFDVPPQLINDRTMVPMRKIFVCLGATVNWDDAKQTVTATKDNTTITLQIESSDMDVNGTVATLDVPAQIINDSTMVPARAVAEALGATVNWDNSTQTVKITQ